MNNVNNINNTTSTVSVEDIISNVNEYLSFSEYTVRFKGYIDQEAKKHGFDICIRSSKDVMTNLLNLYLLYDSLICIGLDINLGDKSYPTLPIIITNEELIIRIHLFPRDTETMQLFLFKISSITLLSYSNSPLIACSSVNQYLKENNYSDRFEINEAIFIGNDLDFSITVEVKEENLKNGSFPLA